MEHGPCIDDFLLLYNLRSVRGFSVAMFDYQRATVHPTQESVWLIRWRPRFDLAFHDTYDHQTLYMECQMMFMTVTLLNTSFFLLFLDVHEVSFMFHHFSTLWCHQTWWKFPIKNGWFHRKISELIVVHGFQPAMQLITPEGIPALTGGRRLQGCRPIGKPRRSIADFISHMQYVLTYIDGVCIYIYTYIYTHHLFIRPSI